MAPKRSKAARGRTARRPARPSLDWEGPNSVREIGEWLIAQAERSVRPRTATFLPAAAAVSARGFFRLLAASDWF